MTTTGLPTPALTESGALPSGVTFTDNQNGTATLSGTPAPNTGGTYNLTFTAANGVLPNATQSFILTVTQAPAITSANNTTFTVGAAGSFTVTTTGFPTPALTESGALPSGVSFVDNGNGTATLSGIPSAAGTYPLSFTAANGVLPDATQSFTLTVTPSTSATVSAVSVSWGKAGTAALQTAPDGLLLLPAGRNTDLPWLGINKLAITLSAPESLTAADVTVNSAIGVNYGPVTVSGSGTSYTITLAQPINAADRVTVTIGNANITTFTRRLDVLPGDVNDDGVVTVQDAVDVINDMNQPYSVSADVMGDGVVDMNDYLAVRVRIGTTLPPLITTA